MKISELSKTILLVLFTLAPVSNAIGGEINAVINGKSFHVNAAENWNEDNIGLGIEYRFSSSSKWKPVIMANGFRDSSDDMSYMMGAGIHRNLFTTDRLLGFYVDAGINAFLMTRKDVNNNRPFPGALPSLTVGNRYMGFNLSYLPRKAVEKLYDAHMMDDSISGIVFLQFKLRVDRFFAAD